MKNCHLILKTIICWHNRKIGLGWRVLHWGKKHPRQSKLSSVPYPLHSMSVVYGLKDHSFKPQDWCWDEEKTRSSGDRLPFLTGSHYGHKISWLYQKTSQVQGSQVIFLLSWQVFQKFSRDRAEIMIFWDRKSQNQFFSIFFTTKSPNFISNLNDDCSQLSFEVYNICVAKKLWILEFLI